MPSRLSLHTKRLRGVRLPCLLSSHGQLKLCQFLICKVVEMSVGLGPSCPPRKQWALDMRVGLKLLKTDCSLSKWSFWQKVEGITFCLRFESWLRRVKLLKRKEGA